MSTFDRIFVLLSTSIVPLKPSRRRRRQNGSPALHEKLRGLHGPHEEPGRGQEADFRRVHRHAGRERSELVFGLRRRYRPNLRGTGSLEKDFDLRMNTSESDFPSFESP